MTTLDDYPIPNINDLYYKVSGGHYFIKVDLSDVYLQILPNDESQKLTMHCCTQC